MTAMAMPPSNARIVEVKTRVEELKCQVRNLMERVADAKRNIDSKYPKRESDKAEHRRLIKLLQAAQNDLGNAKLELTKLSGTTGHDPRWKLLREAWLVLNQLEEAGVTIGPRAEALLEEIEFHLPNALLQETPCASNGAEGEK